MYLYVISQSVIHTQYYTSLCFTALKVHYAKLPLHLDLFMPINIVCDDQSVSTHVYNQQVQKTCQSEGLGKFRKTTNQTKSSFCIFLTTFSANFSLFFCNTNNDLEKRIACQPVQRKRLHIYPRVLQVPMFKTSLENQIL